MPITDWRVALSKIAKKVPLEIWNVNQNKSLILILSINCFINTITNKIVFFDIYHFMNQLRHFWGEWTHHWGKKNRTGVNSFIKFLKTSYNKLNYWKNSTALLKIVINASSTILESLLLLNGKGFSWL